MMDSSSTGDKATTRTMTTMTATNAIDSEEKDRHGHKRVDDGEAPKCETTGEHENEGTPGIRNTDDHRSPAETAAAAAACERAGLKTRRSVQSHMRKAREKLIGGAWVGGALSGNTSPTTRALHERSCLIYPALEQSLSADSILGDECKLRSKSFEEQLRKSRLENPQLWNEGRHGENLDRMADRAQLFNSTPLPQGSVESRMLLSQENNLLKTPPCARDRHRAISADGTLRSPDLSFFGKREDVLSPGESKPIIIKTGIVWKRRNGFAGMLTSKNAWERRRLLLLETELIYFTEGCDVSTANVRRPQSACGDGGRLATSLADLKSKTYRGVSKGIQIIEYATSEVTSVVTGAPGDDRSSLTGSATDPNEPRGHIDLIKDDITVSPTTCPSGAPTPFALSIRMRGETKWKFCFETHKDQMDWMVEISNIVIRRSVEMYISEHGLQNNEQLATKQSDDTVNDIVVESEKATEGCQSCESAPGAASSPPLCLTGNRLKSALVLANLGLFFGYADTPTFWFIVVVFNCAVIYLLDEERQSIEVSARFTNAGVSDGKRNEKQRNSIKSLPPVTRNRDTYMPVAGSSTVKLINEGDENRGKNGVLFPGWRDITGSSLSVRSQGYEETKLKIPSFGTLYDCVAVDVFDSDARVPDVGARVKLPELKYQVDKPKNWHSPDVFVVSIAIPSEAKLGFSSNDGPGFTVVMYCTMRKETRMILEMICDPACNLSEIQWPLPEMANRVNGVKLFEEWCGRAPTDPAFQARFKMIPDALNLTEIGLPSYITKYRNKPLLIKRQGVTGTLYAHPKSMEFHINFHAFPYLAKQAFSYMKDAYFKKVIVNVGFTIEGRRDDELPEMIIGGFQLCYPDPAHAVQGIEFFRGTCPTSF